MVELTAPYVPGYLAFREAEPLVQLINSQRENKPELTPQVREINLNLNLVFFYLATLISKKVILVDGNGVLHPSRFGLACHIGVMADIPTVGVAKNLFQVSNICTVSDFVVRTDWVHFRWRISV